MKTRFIAKTFAWFALVAVILCSCYNGDINVDCSISADGSSTLSTGGIFFYFNAVNERDKQYFSGIDGLTASDISLSGIPGITKGTLINRGKLFIWSDTYSYFLPISGFTASGNLKVSVSKSGYYIHGSPQTVPIYYYNTPAVTFESVQADGSYSLTTTQLKLTFSQEIPNLTASDITLSGVTGVTKGTFSNFGRTCTLDISGFTKGGTLSVAVAKSGINIRGSPQTVTIYKAQ